VTGLGIKHLIVIGTGEAVISSLARHGSYRYSGLRKALRIGRRRLDLVDDFNTTPVGQIDRLERPKYSILVGRFDLNCLAES
jgi:hypothetical protein